MLYARQNEIYPTWKTTSEITTHLSWATLRSELLSILALRRWTWSVSSATWFSCLSFSAESCRSRLIFIDSKFASTIAWEVCPLLMDSLSARSLASDSCEDDIRNYRWILPFHSIHSGPLTFLFHLSWLSHYAMQQHNGRKSTLSLMHLSHFPLKPWSNTTRNILSGIHDRNTLKKQVVIRFSTSFSNSRSHPHIFLHAWYHDFDFLQL